MIRPIDYKQNDTKWGSNSYAVDGEVSTIKSAGCGPTALADVLGAIVSPYIDPLTCASWSRMHGYKVYKSGTSYNFPAAIGKHYGVEVRRLNNSSVYGVKSAAAHGLALTELRKGNWLIACMGKGNWTSSGHYIVAYGIEGGTVYINDPASTKETRHKNTWVLFSSQVKYYWVVEVPDKIKQNGIVQDGKYPQADFIRECQMTLKAGLTEKADSLTLNKTVTVSRTKNRTHNVVLPLQKKLKDLGFYTDNLDCKAGKETEAAINGYQTKILDYKKLDGEITAKNKMWKSLIGIINK